MRNRHTPKGSERTVNGALEPAHCGCFSPSSKYACLTLVWSKRILAEAITILHECQCWIEISHPRGRKLTRDRLMMDCFFPLFEGFLSEHKKNSIKGEKFNYLLDEYTLFLSSRDWNGCKHSLYLVIAWITRWELKCSCNIQNKFLLCFLCH